MYPMLVEQKLSRNTHTLRNIKHLHFKMKQSVEDGQLDKNGAGERENIYFGQISLHFVNSVLLFILIRCMLSHCHLCWCLSLTPFLPELVFE